MVRMECVEGAMGGATRQTWLPFLAKWKAAIATAGNHSSCAHFLSRRDLVGGKWMPSVGFSQSSGDSHNRIIGGKAIAAPSQYERSSRFLSFGCKLH